jgi:hypothetical protein
MQKIVSSELARLDPYDIPFAKKLEIRDTVDSMKSYYLQNNMEHNAGPGPLIKSVRRLFGALSVSARESVIGSLDDSTSLAFDESEQQSTSLEDFTLSWQPAPRDKLPAHLVELIDKTLAGYRPILQDSNPKAMTTTSSASGDVDGHFGDLEKELESLDQRVKALELIQDPKITQIEKPQ